MINPPVRPLTFSELFGGHELAEKGMLVSKATAPSAQIKDSSLPFLVLTGIAITVVAVAIYQYEAGRKEERKHWQQRLDIKHQVEQYS